MSPDKALLCYGIFASSQSLLVAISTRRKVNRTVILLDAIQRKRTRPGMTAIVYSVPPEIWEMVKTFLLEVERRVSESDLVKEALCLYCTNQLENPQKLLDFGYLDARLSYEGSKACRSCKSSAAKTRRQLLDQYDLALFCNDYFDTGGSVICPISPTTYNLICLPSYSPNLTSCSGKSNKTGPIRQFDVVLPSEVADRFERAVDELHLRPVRLRDASIGLLVCAPTPEDDDDDDECVVWWHLVPPAGGRSRFW